MSSLWKGRSFFSGQNNDDDDQQDEYYEPSGGGRKRPSSRLRWSSNNKQTDEDRVEDDEYPNYTARSYEDADYDRYSRNGGSYHNNTSSNPYYNGGGYSNSSPYSNGGGGYGNSSPYSNGGGYGDGSTYSNGGSGYSNGGYAPYNIPASSYRNPQEDGTRSSPMVIRAREVNVYGAPSGSQYDNDNYNDQRKDGSSGFFGPAFHAVGHFVDRRLGFHDRD